MSKDRAPNQTISEQELLDYLDGKIQGIRANQIERQILNSSFDEDAFEGLSSIHSEELKQDLSKLKKRLGNRTNEKPAYLNIAATIAFLIAAFSSLYFVVNNALPHKEISINRTFDKESAESLNLAMNDRDSIQADSLEADIEPTIAITDLEADSTPILALTQEIPEDSTLKEEIALATNIDTSVTDDDSLFEADIISESTEVAVLSEPSVDETFDDSAIQESQIVARTEGEGAASRQAFNETSSPSAKSAAAPATPQETTATSIISGAVYYREDGEPLPGVKVTLGEATTFTGLDGKFEITNAADVSSLEFSLQGVSPKTVGIEDSQEINVVMAPDASSLQEVTIIGYGLETASQISKSPEPESGVAAFKNYIESSKVYPEEAKADQIKGAVLLKVTVSSEGSINNVEVKKSLSSECDQEALRLLREGPEWKPALYNGEPVEGFVRIRIPFQPGN